MERIEEFIKNEIKDLEDFVFTLEEEKEYVYANFTEVLGEEKNKELMFQVIGDILYLHLSDYGWKAVQKGSNNKYFWIELLK